MNISKNELSKAKTIQLTSTIFYFILPQLHAAPRKKKIKREICREKLRIHFCAEKIDLFLFYRFFEPFSPLARFRKLAKGVKLKFLLFFRSAFLFSLFSSKFNWRTAKRPAILLLLVFFFSWKHCQVIFYSCLSPGGKK